MEDMEETEDYESCKSIHDLPEEILELILMKVSPYRDLKSASLVCTAWHKQVKGRSRCIFSK